jgi:predicted Rossmann-fold nucleotide-binding protein
MVKFKRKPERMIRGIKSLQAFLTLGIQLQDCAVVGIDFEAHPVDWTLHELDHVTFLGCNFCVEDEVALRRRGAFIYPRHPDLPYDPYRAQLYTWQELMQGFEGNVEQSLDYCIYHHFEHRRFNPDINEALNQRMHDHAIDDALRDLMDYDDGGMTQRKCIGIMGGHGTLRTDIWYHRVAETAKRLTEQGYFIASGGGPGIMEAANLGAWMAGHSHAALEEVLHVLGKAPHYTDPGYFDAAQEVLALHPDGADSLAIPTWFYGHEPSNLFATHIAKYFSNSIREDTLLAVSLHGVVFAPGSAGTTQEIFMDAAQNHYATHNYCSPMVFLGRQRYEIDTLLYPLIRQLSFGKSYHDLLCLTDSPSEVVEFLLKHPPIKK